MELIKCKRKESIIPTSEFLILLSVASSITYSLFLFFLCGKPLTAIFIGLLAPTLMGIINYINTKFK
jgi:hypothetical protein